MIYHGPPKFLALIGLPRSGTSIIARTIHSLENGFCIAEPLHRAGFERIKRGESLDKIGPISVSEYNGVIPAIYEAWNDPFSPWQIGGVKEVDVINNGGTFTRWDELFKDSPLFVPVFIHREPEMIYDAWKRSEFKTRGITAFIKTWNWLRSLEKQHNGLAIGYEDFCINPLETLNKTFADYGVFSGEVTIKPMKGNMGPMDPKAQKSVKIEPAKTEPATLSAIELAMIKKNCV